MTRTADAVRVRAARHDDYDAVAAFTRGTWPGRDSTDYIPRVYHDWIDGDEGRKRTVVAEVDGEVAGLAQAVLLSDWEAWNQGMRVHPDYRGRGVSVAVTEDLFEWARERGATVARNMVFSWNEAGLGQSRSMGYAPATEFRWARPEPDPDADPEADVTADPDAAWRFWTDSDAHDHLRGLALDDDESWAVSRLARADLRAAADDDGLFVVQDGGTRGFAHRVREFEREVDADESDDSGTGAGETERWAEYGVGAWADADSAGAVLAAVARDAAARGADRTRVLIPETVETVSDAAACRVDVSDDPDFVMAADLTGR
ncbi:GNAT family N-acetyltransferase [Halorussus halobius]|uniref:GNAT family N-acetyltransferase n=1 Tax=Halorussus halobius TaxID=1710537 RepID=UPI0010922A32|nr:GNAT family N-acetyltransferase [Halorussus halobius]